MPLKLLVCSFLAVFLLPAKAFSEEKVGRHLFEHYCAVCHGISGKGDGVNAKSLDPEPADLTSGDIIDRSDEEIYDVILKGGAGVELAPTMPIWGKTFTPDQIKALVTYVRQIQKGAPSPKGVRLADLKAAGKDEQCSVCHVQKGKPRQIAPNLGHEGSKFHKDWLYKFLKNPNKIRPVGYMPLTKARMPNFNLSDEEAGALTEYLLSLKEDRFVPIAPPLDRSEEAVSKGQSLFSDIYGCDGCHKVSEKGDGGIVGPNLSVAPRRLQPEWIYAWLKNPQSIRPDSPMPNFGLSDPEIRSLTAYILSLGKEASSASTTPVNVEMIGKGKDIVEKKNCLFCHTLESGESHVAAGAKGVATP